MTEYVLHSRQDHCRMIPPAARALRVGLVCYAYRSHREIDVHFVTKGLVCVDFGDER